jgi:hypothetical protein
MRPCPPLHGRIPTRGPLLRVSRPNASEWAKVKEKAHLLDRQDRSPLGYRQPKGRSWLPSPLTERAIPAFLPRRRVR